MKIRQRLALLFTIVSALLTGTILLFIFTVTKGFVHADFIERLTQQSRVEVLHYAAPNVKDVIPPGAFQLVNPFVSIYSEEGILLHHSGAYPIPESWVIYLKQYPLFNAERGPFSTVGRRYDINGHRYLVFVSDKDLPGQHELDILMNVLVIGWLISIALSYLAGLYFSGNALEPVQHVVREVKQITEDNLGYRVKLKSDNTKDEIDELILTFNALLSRIENAFVAQKRFVQHASHELKTPLTAILAEAELALARDRSTDQYKRTLEVIVGETDRLVNITQGLLTLTRLEEGVFQVVKEVIDVNTLVENVVSTFKRHHPTRNLVLDMADQNEDIEGNIHLLQIALTNVCDNAVKYSSDKIIFRVFYQRKEVVFSIQDFGVGIPSHELDKVSSPLFRASNVNAVPGAGLGLSLVDRIIKIHHGSTTITSEEGKGTCFEIRLMTK